jgi:hypothetical protein
MLQENLRPEDGTRPPRIYNIAVTLIKLKESGEYDVVSTKKLREIIRMKLTMPKVHGLALDGDIRATGDACGGHGLKLESRVTKIGNVKHRLIKLTDENIAKCKKYLAKAPSPRILI